MPFFEHILNAFGVLQTNKMRSGLSMLGIIIGVASVIILIAVWQGTTQSIVSRVQSLGTNLILITPWAQKSTDIRRIAFGGNNTTKVLTTDHVTALQNAVAGITAVAPEVSLQKQVVYMNKNTQGRIVGTTPAYQDVRNFHVQVGQFFDDTDVQKSTKVAVIGASIAQNLFDTESPLGKTIIFGDRMFTVIGVMEAKWSGGSSSSDTMIFIPLTTAQRVLTGNEYVTTISVSVWQTDMMDTVKAQITELLLIQTKAKSADDAQFTVSNQADALSTAQEITQTLTLFLGGIAGISLIVWGIGVMNIMLVAVTERTREIGIRKALGANRRDILLQFLTESFVLSCIGGVLGVLLSYGVVWAVRTFSSLGAVVSVDSLIVSFAFSATVGMVFGLLPAYKASKLNTIDALRYE